MRRNTQGSISVRLFPDKSWMCAMKSLVAVFLMFVLGGHAYAGCSGISNNDQRKLCEARTNGGSCGSIDDRDLRYLCNAETGHGGCGSIDDSDQRKLCEAKINGGSCGSIDNNDLRNQCDALKR